MASTTITVQPGAVLPPNAKINTWSTGLCDCCDDMSICEYMCISGVIKRKCAFYSIIYMLHLKIAQHLYLKKKACWKIDGFEEACPRQSVDTCPSFIAVSNILNQIKLLKKPLAGRMKNTEGDHPD